MDEKKFQDAIVYISDFIKSLSDEVVISKGEKPSIFFIRYDEGSFILNKDEAFRYSKSLGLLLSAVNEDTISQKAVERYFQDAILYATDLQKKRQDIPLDNRIKQAIASLHESLSQNPRTFKIYQPVFGVSNDGLPVKIGNILFFLI